MKTTLQTLLVTLFGAITSLIVAIILSFIEIHWRISIYSYSFWLVIPVGALGAGFVAAAGYYLGSILFNRTSVLNPAPPAFSQKPANH